MDQIPEGLVVARPLVNNGQGRWEAELLAMEKKNKWHTSDLKFLLYSGSTELKSGELLLLDARWSDFPTGSETSGFDLKQFYNDKRISFRAFAREIKSIGGTSDYIQRLRNMIFSRLEILYPDGMHRGLVAGILLGDKSGLSTEVKEAFQRIGGMHVLAVSGLHVSIIYLMFHMILTLLPGYRLFRVCGIVLIIICIWHYAAITGFTPSVTRASLFLSILSTSRLINRTSDLHHVLPLTAFLVCLTNPFQIFQAGFQFSYAAVFGIMLFQPLFENFLRRSGPILKYFARIITVSVSAQMFTWPLMVYYFGSFSFGGILFSVILLPAVFAILVLTIASIFITFLPFETNLASSLLGQFLADLLEIVFVASERFAGYLNMDESKLTLVMGLIFSVLVYLFVWRPDKGRLLAVICTGFCLVTSLFLFDGNAHASRQIELLSENGKSAVIFRSGVGGIILSEGVHSQPIYRNKLFHIGYSLSRPQLLNLGGYRIFITNSGIPDRLNADIALICLGYPPKKFHGHCPEIFLGTSLSADERYRWHRWSEDNNIKVTNLFGRKMILTE